MLMDQGQGLPVSSNFLFIPITQERLSKDDGGDARFIDLNTFDSIRRYRAFNESVFAESFKTLWGLPGKQYLLASRFPKVCQIPGSGCRNRFTLPGKKA